MISWDFSRRVYHKINQKPTVLADPLVNLEFRRDRVLFYTVLIEDAKDFDVQKESRISCGRGLM